jgi:hypothetical protein
LRFSGHYLAGPIAPDNSAVGTRWRPPVIDVTDC